MTESSRAVLIEERVAQLQSVICTLSWFTTYSSPFSAISARRNELLRQMYHLIQQRNNVGAVLPDEAQEEDETDLHKFLQRFDLTKKCVGRPITVILIDERRRLAEMLQLQTSLKMNGLQSHW